MAPPTATATTVQEGQSAILKMETAAPAQKENEEMECQLPNLSRGPNPLMGETMPFGPWVYRSHG